METGGYRLHEILFVDIILTQILPPFCVKNTTSQKPPSSLTIPLWPRGARRKFPSRKSPLQESPYKNPTPQRSAEKSFVHRPKHTLATSGTNTGEKHHSVRRKLPGGKKTLTRGRSNYNIAQSSPTRCPLFANHESRHFGTITGAMSLVLLTTMSPPPSSPTPKSLFPTLPTRSPTL